MAAKVALPGLVDDAHAAPAQLAHQLITVHDRPRRFRRGGFEPPAQRVRQTGEAQEVLFRRRRLAALAPQQELAVHQLERLGVVLLEMEIVVEIGFRRDALAGQPALALIDAQYGGALGRRRLRQAGEELAHVGPSAAPPLLPEEAVGAVHTGGLVGAGAGGGEGGLHRGLLPGECRRRRPAARGSNRSARVRLRPVKEGGGRHSISNPNRAAGSEQRAAS